MKTVSLVKDITITGIAIVFVMTLMVPAVPAANPKFYKMAGKISAIDLKFNTVVINVPITEKKNFKVGGPLAKDAILKKENKENVSLRDFKVGDKIVVEWESSPQGPVLKLLKFK